MAIEIRNFKRAGMDNDSSIEDIEPNDTLENFNIRFTGTSAQEESDATNIESTSQITGTRHSGINQGIGASGFERTRKGYGFIYNSFGYHQIVEIDYDTEVQTVVFENKTQSGGEDVLPLNPQYYVNDIKLINGILFPFTDSNMQPCYINMERLKAGGYGTLTADDFLLIKAQPMVIPVATYNDDASRSVNLLRGNLFQPISQYVYLDNEYSAWSSMGKRPVPTDESTPSIGTNVALDNNLLVQVDAGTNRVITVNVGMRIGTLDFFLVKSISRAEIIALPNTAVNVSQEIYEAYDPSTNLYSFAFYNDGLYPNIDVLETDLPYDYVPIKAGAMEVINGSILALGDITEGYDRPTIDVTISQTSYEPNIAFSNSGDPLKVTTWDQYRPSGESYRRVTVVFGGTPQTGDVITIITSNLDGVVYNTISHTVTIAQDGNLLASIQGLAVVMPYPTNVVARFDGTVVMQFTTRRESETPDGGREMMKGYVLTLVDAGTGQSKSIPALKTNSAYQLALALKDKYGRYFPIASGRKYITKTQSFAQLQGLTPKIHWTINTATAPAGATHYQWLLSENNTHEETLWMNAILDTTNTNSEYFVFKINSLLKFNTNNSSSVLSYDYTIGDRATFVYELTAGVKTYFNNIDVEVSGFEIVVDTVPTPDVTNYLLKVAKPSTISQASITGKNILLEIYTPKKRAITTGGSTTYEEQTFFEVGIQYPIVNGQFSVLSGDVTDGDIYLKTRQLANAVDPNTSDIYVVEDFNFSDFYPSKFTSYGRPRTYNDLRGQVRKMASIRYSDTFLEGSLINGITRFFAERIYGEGAGETSSNYGAINKIRQIGNYLVCIQDTKTGSIPVNISIIEDQTSQSNVAVSDRLLNYIRYSSAGSFGMGGCKESYSERPDGTIYFIDPNNSLPIRIGQDGTSVISGKMTKFFRATLQAAVQAGRKVIGIYDIFNDEYMIGIQQGGDVLTQFAFNATNWRYENPYTILPANITITTNPTKGVVDYSTDTGIATYTANAGTSGSDFFIQTFLVNGNPVTVRTCITILPGDKTPDPFYFVDLIGQELSTLLESNPILISGINIPSPISIVGGEYEKNNSGVWTSSAGTVVDGDSVIVRRTSSASYNTQVDATLTVDSYSDTFSITTKDNVPDPFTFIDITDAELSTIYISNSVTITGITGLIPISIVDGQYSINGGAFTDVTGTITNGSTVRVRRTSSDSYVTAESTTLTVGTYSDTYTITTKPDLTPDPFVFTDVVDADLSTVYTSNMITISGLTPTYSVPVTMSAGGTYSKNGGGYTSSAGTAQNGDTFTVRQTSSASYITAVNATLTVGGVSDTYTVTTKNDLTPDPFTFTDVVDKELSTVYESNIVTITGITAPVAISITTGEYRINGGSWTSSAGTVSNNDTVQVRRTSSASYSTTLGTTLTAGGVSDTYSITTKSGTPSPFTFVDVIDKELSTVYVSNTITMAGYVTGLPISITTGEYSINGGSFTSVAGTINVGDTVAVRRTSSASYSTAVTTTLTVGTYSDTYSITTKSGTPTPPFAFTDVFGKEVNTIYISNPVTLTGFIGALPISVVGGQYRIDGGSWTSISGTVNVGSVVEVRRTSSPDYSSTVGVDLTVGTQSDTYSITTRAALNVPVNYSMVFGADPTTDHWNVFERTRLGVTTNVATIQNVVSGTLPSGDFKEGDTFRVYQGAYTPFVWAPSSKVTLIMDVDGDEYYNDEVTSQAGTQNTGAYVIPAGVTSIDISSVGSSIYAYGISYDLIVNNELSLDDVGVTVFDSDEASGLGLDELHPNAGSAGYPFNTTTLGSTDLSVVIFNYTGSTINYNLNSGLHVGTISPMGSVSWTDVPKSDINLVIT